MYYSAHWIQLRDQVADQSAARIKRGQSVEQLARYANQVAEIAYHCDDVLHVLNDAIQLSPEALAENQFEVLKRKIDECLREG